MKRDYFDSLIEKYKNNQLSPEELNLLEEWLDKIDYSSQENLWDEKEEAILKSTIQEKLFSIRSIRSTYYSKVAVLAAVLLVSILTGYFWYRNNNTVPVKYTQITESKELIPEIAKGVLIDESGKDIQLNTLKYDSLYQLGELTVRRITENEIIILSNDSAEVKMKQIFAPRGGGFTVRFEDNSRATLNANSHIIFPSRFSTNKRIVEVSGEVFFDVEKDVNRRAFVVKAGEISINVLGTKFNVQHKKGQSFKASLFEGIIHVDHKNFSEKLLPGKEFSMDEKGNYSISDINPPSINAWKEGKFFLDGKNIVEIMEEIQNWYNVEVIYEDIDPNIKYKGSISKFSNVEAVLEILSLAEGNKFEMKERRIIVR